MAKPLKWHHKALFLTAFVLPALRDIDPVCVNAAPGERTGGVDGCKRHESGADCRRPPGVLTPPRDDLAILQCDRAAVGAGLECAVRKPERPHRSAAWKIILLEKKCAVGIRSPPVPFEKFEVCEVVLTEHLPWPSRRCASCNQDRASKRHDTNNAQRLDFLSAMDRRYRTDGTNSATQCRKKILIQPCDMRQRQAMRRVFVNGKSGTRNQGHRWCSG